MNYVVTWWDGAVKKRVDCKDIQSAQETAQALRKRSDVFILRSLVPIRVIPERVSNQMQELEKTKDTLTCKHGLLRLCLKCMQAIA